MRNEDNFTNVVCHGRAAFSADVRCGCGGTAFSISHTGTYHKGLFGGHTIRIKKGQAAVKCRCTVCGRELLLYDSTIDRDRHKEVYDREWLPLSIDGTSSFYQCEI